MAKGSNDVILRDRLQFDINNVGNTALVYGRIDMSDYVSIVENKGLAIKEIRFQLRRPSTTLGNWPQVMTEDNIAGTTEAYVKIFATTTAYELVSDVGIGSPNVICIQEVGSTLYVNATSQPTQGENLVTDVINYGTPDLHPEGYDIVTDLLIGIACSQVDRLANETCELDVMIIAEPKKITQKDLTQMLTQAQDL
jgi:hypothetical protein